MQTAIRRTVTVQKGGMIQLCAPELPVGATAEVIILLDASTPLVDYSDEWSDEDLQDFSRAGWELINKRLEEEENA